MFIGLTTAEDGTGEVFNINYITRVRPAKPDTRGAFVSVVGEGETRVYEEPEQIMVRIAECIQAEALMRAEVIAELVHAALS